MEPGEGNNVKGYRAVLPHYYGDTVRKLFLVGAVVILLATPLFSHLFAPLAFLPLFVVVGLGVLAGLISPTQKLVAFLQTCVSAIAVVGFGLYSVLLYAVPGHVDWHRNVLLLLAVFLSLNFLFALYYRSKALRGFFPKK